jgi:hypothetical protein
MKRVLRIVGVDGSAEVLAEFELRRGKLVASYMDERYRREVEGNGIFTIKSGTVRPTDGKPFYDALSTAYANSSRIRVVEA